MMTPIPANQVTAHCTCNRDWIFRHTSHAPDGDPLGGKLTCYTCGLTTRFDYSFRESRRIIWKHESLGNGVWPIPDDVWVELQKMNAQRGKK
ncbi:hypothetical protein Pori4_00017 [Pseudomonas phage vB_PpuM-Pori-4]